ncbi:MAG: sugar nucleotide-binding protein, partial [Acidobacteriota bacterium]|nr:sugar nucleotide-binding protein [Acidobacteriota bacterium]
MSEPKILVLGGAGMLGHKMFQTLRERFPGTLCTTRRAADSPEISRFDRLWKGSAIPGVDVMKPVDLERTLREIRPDFMVNCVGVIKQRREAHLPIPSITVNSLLPHQLAGMAANWGGRVIHFSTDCVFSGKRGQYTENDPSDAEDLYGKSKFLGEVAVSNALTLRTSIIGRELSEHQSLLDWFLSQNHRKVRGFTRVIYSGVTTNH